MHAEDGRIVVTNVGINTSDPCGFREFRAVACDICCLRPNDADEVTHLSCFVIRDLEVEGREDLPDPCEVLSQTVARRLDQID